MPHLYIAKNFPSAGLNLLREAGYTLEINESDEPISQQELIAICRDKDGIMSTGSNQIDSVFLDACPQIRIIAEYGAGYDNIDVEAASARGVVVTNTPNTMSDATADISFGLMIATARKMFYMHKSIIEGKWQHFRPQANLGFELHGKTLGIFGLGRIGIKMAERCKGAYDMPIIYCNRNRDIGIETRLGARYVSFEELITESDILSVHCPLTSETRHKFDRKVFQKMKSTALFINTARGPVHHEEDLLNALVEGEIWGAGLDVTDPEPSSSDNPLLSLPNACVLPHIGSATFQARDAMSILAARNLISFFTEGKAPNSVNSDS